jgi:hypothetical protein
MKTLDGIEFELGMTLYDPENSEDGIFITEFKTNTQEMTIEKIRDYHFAVYQNGGGRAIELCYGKLENAVAALIPEIDREIAYLQNKKEKYLKGDIDA